MLLKPYGDCLSIHFWPQWHLSAQLLSWALIVWGSRKGQVWDRFRQVGGPGKLFFFVAEGVCWSCWILPLLTTFVVMSMSQDTFPRDVQTSVHNMVSMVPVLLKCWLTHMKQIRLWGLCSTWPCIIIFEPYDAWGNLVTFQFDQIWYNSCLVNRFFQSCFSLWSTAIKIHLLPQVFVE